MATQANVAREVGAEQIVAVATAAIRNAPNRDALVTAVHEAGGMELEVLSGEEEARLSFVGATRTLLQPADGTIAVIDVGGGSSEIAVGEPDGKMAWSASFRIGSGFLADSYLRCDPPSVDELEKVRRHVAGTFEGLEPPPAERARSRSAARRPRCAACWARSSRTRRWSAASACCPRPRSRRSRPASSSTPSACGCCRRASSCWRRSRTCSTLPLRIARGGLREGVLLELVEGRRLALRAASARGGASAR